MAVDKEGEFTMEIRDAPPAHLLLKIESFSKLSKHGILKYESKEFVAGNYKWRLIIYPQDCGGSNVSVYLSVAKTETLPEGWEVTVDCSILLHNQTPDNYFCFSGKARRFDASNPRWGFSISSRMLAEVCNIGGDNCTFGAEVFFLLRRSQVNECLSLHDWKISDFSKLGDVWNSEEFLAGGFRWMIRLYPKLNGGSSVAIYLECVDSKTFASHEKVKADFCIRIKNKLPHAHASKSASFSFSSKKMFLGLHSFIPIADMRDPSKGFIINDCCFLEVEISVQDAVYKPK